MRDRHNLSAFSHLNAWIEGELYSRQGANHVPLSKNLTNRLKGQGLDSRPEESCVIFSDTGQLLCASPDRTCPITVIRHGDRAALAYAFVTFPLKPVWTIEQMKMAAVSRLTDFSDFSFDWYPLFTPVSKKSHPSCTTRVTTAGSSKS